MGPTQNDFVNQFEQQVSGPSSSKGGDIILTPDQTQKSKKPIIIAAIAVVFLLAVGAVVLLLKGGNLGNNGNSKEFINNYALSVAYGPQHANHTVSDIKALADTDFYISDYEKTNMEYLKSLEETLAKAEQSSAKDSSVRQQLNALRVFIAVSSYLDDSIPIENKYQYTLPEGANNELRNAQSVLQFYAEISQEKGKKLEEYENGDITYDDYLEYVAAYGRASDELQQEYYKFKNKIINYVSNL